MPADVIDKLIKANIELDKLRNLPVEEVARNLKRFEGTAKRIADLKTDLNYRLGAIS